MIKAVIDSYRARKGYAGMAVYREGVLLFCEGFGPELADRIKALFKEARVSYSSTRVTAVILGYSVSASCEGEALIISRFEGRFVPLPDITTEDPQYSTGEPTTRLITRDEARKEAEHLLGTLKVSPKDFDKHPSGALRNP